MAEQQQTDGTDGAQETEVMVTTTVTSEHPGVPSVPDLRRIGRYPVLGKLGEGGMGAVYAAYDEQLDRRIAIKLLIRSGGPRDERNRTRIKREAQAMARLSHPAVAHVYEVGEFEGLTYIAMEYVRGTTLKEWAKQPHPLTERLEVLLQAGRGLVAAHRAGVVHRDFKPDNVMVDRHLRARVLDFGLAQAHDDESVERTEETFPPPSDSVDNLSPELTGAGTVMGTPAYMSPEQHLGASTSTSTDQYSFCAVAYEMLYGVRPYSGPNRLAIAYAIHKGEMNPPPADHKVPAAIHQVIVRGLAKQPEQRWPSMEALVDALEAAMGGKKRPWLWPIITGIGVVIIVVLAAMLWMRPEPPAPGELDRVEALAQAATEAGAQAHWVYPMPESPRDTALVHVHELEGLAESEGEAPAVSQSAAARAQQLRSDFGAALVRLGDYYWEREGGRVFARDFYLQAVLFDGSLSRARERSGFSNGEVADIRARALQGELTEAELEVAGDLVELAAVVPGDEQATQTAGLGAGDPVAQVLAEAQRKRKLKQAVELGLDPEPEPKPVLADVPPQPEPEPEPEGETEGDAETEGEPEAEPEPEQDDAAREAARKESQALVAEAHSLRKAGRASAAEAKFFAALRVNGRNAAAHDGLRWIKFDAGRYAEAVPHAEKAVRYAGSNARYRRALGDVYFKVGRLADAEAAYAKAVALGDAKAEDRLAMVRKKLGR